MAIYLEQNTVKDLIEYRNRIFALAKEAYKKYGIDILANDTLNSLSIHEIVSQYDTHYNINFHRNHEDAKSNGILIENKCSTVKPNKKGIISNSGWQFHAQGKLNYSRYIFAVRRKDSLTLVRLYDISSKPAIDAVQTCLAELKQKWIDRGKPNHDAIVVPEKLLFQFTPSKKTKINDCEVIEI